MKQVFLNTVLLYTIPLLDDGMDVDDDSDGWIAVSHSEDEMSGDDDDDDDDEDAQQLKGWFYFSLFICILYVLSTVRVGTEVCQFGSSLP